MRTLRHALTFLMLMTAEFARYATADVECCPSVIRVTYRLNLTGRAPVLEAVDARKVR